MKLIARTQHHGIKTATTPTSAVGIGLTIPQDILIAADEVIE
jgi:hypothetical protein